MAGVLFTACVGAVSVSAVQDFFSLKASSSVPLQLVALEIDQTGNSDVGDAQEEMLRFQIKIGATTQGSGGSVPTGKNSRGQTATATIHANDTTQSSAGTALTLLERAFNIRAGLIWMPTPEMQEAFVCPVSQIIQIAFPAAPADAVTFSGTVYYRELVF